MKKLTTLVFLSLLLSLFNLHIFSQPCLPEGITFTTQEEIDNFQTNYPGCTEIEGDVQINGDDINSLMGLDILTAFEGDLLIGDNTIYPYGSNPLLTNLEGFENVADIGGSLRIFGNDTLASISGLSNLTTIGGCLQINHNYILASLTGLGNLISIGGYLSIINNAELTNIADLGNLNSIGLESGISLWIIGNNKLTGLWGLEGLTVLEGDLRICSNSILSSIEGLENLTSVEGNVRIGYFDPVFGGSGNPLLINLSGLISLISIGGDLIIADNDVLTTLDGLENLNFIGGNLMIGRGEPGNSGGNPLLTDISGLYNIDPASIEGLIIIFNSSLSQCNVQSVCAYLANPTGFVQINNNAPGCNSPEQVDSICNIVSISEIVLGNEFVISPNPNSGSVNLRFVIGEQGLVICDLLNISGVKVKSFFNEMKKSGTHEMEIDLKNIPAGVYFCVLKTNKGIQTKKIVKL